MKVTKVDVDALNAILELEVKKEDFEPKVLNVLKDYRKKADLKGFRKGQVPMGMIKKMYGNAVLMDVINDTLSETVNTYIRENDLDILGSPLPTEGQFLDMDIKDIKDFEFKYDLGISPKFELDFLNSNPKFERDVPKVDKKIIDEEVSRMQKQLGELQEVDAIEKDTDMLSVKFEELDEKGNIKEEGISNTTSISLELIEDKKVVKSLKKLKKGESIEIDIFKTFSQEDEAVAKHLLASEKAAVTNTKFKLTLEEIKRIKEAEINEDFLKKVYGPETGITDEKGLRDKIKGDLTEYFSKQADNKMFNDVYAKLIEETKIDLPDEFLKRWIKLTNEKPISEEQIKEEYPGFSKNLIWSLIVKKIKTEGKIEITEDEIKAKTAEGIKAQMMQYGMQDFAGPEMDNFVASMMAREEHVNQTKDAILEEKVFAFIKTKIKTKDISVSLEDFNKQAAEHNHVH